MIKQELTVDRPQPGFAVLAEELDRHIGLDSAQGKACYALRSRTIEPVFGQVKTVQGGGRFMRRGLRACAAEWKLLCGTHNLLKLWGATADTSH